MVAACKVTGQIVTRITAYCDLVGAMHIARS
jgi:hypothetical protein